MSVWPTKGLAWDNARMHFDAWLNAARKTARGGMPGGGKSPYKPLLLAAVLLRIAQGKLLRPEVRLDQTLRALYRHLRAEAFPSWPFKDDSRQPFVRLAPQVWELRSEGRYEDELTRLLGAGAGAPWPALARATQCALLPPAVHAALCADPVARSRLAAVLVGQLDESRADPQGLQRIRERLAVGAQGSLDIEVEDADDNLLESAIEERLVACWDDTPFAGMGVRLHTNARGEVVGQQYPIGGWYIDLLGWQEARRCWWVIELKRGRASDRVVGQVSRYLGIVDRYLTRPRESTCGVILARSISERLHHACYAQERIEAWTFDSSLRVNAP
jgi:hypothetical protein